MLWEIIYHTACLLTNIINCWREQRRRWKSDHSYQYNSEEYGVHIELDVGDS